MRKLGIYLGIIFGAILLAPFIVDQLFFFLFLGKIPFTKISLPSTVMIVFWTAIIPLAIFARKSLSASIWKIIDIASEISQRRINRAVRYFTPDQKRELILLSVYLLYQIETSEPVSKVESHKLAPSLT